MENPNPEHSYYLLIDGSVELFRNNAGLANLTTTFLKKNIPKKKKIKMLKEFISTIKEEIRRIEKE